jgi:hypothetical protein
MFLKGREVEGLKVSLEAVSRKLVSLAARKTDNPTAQPT